MSIRDAGFVGVIILLLTGCANTFSLGDSDSDPGKLNQVDAVKLPGEFRLITQRTRQSPNGNGRITCTEPNSDIARAITDSLGVKGSYQNVSVELTDAYAQSITQIGKRYATVQLLQNMRFRDCEDYANGTITDVVYAYKTSHFDDLVVTLLGLEMLGDSSPTTMKPDASTPISKGTGLDADATKQATDSASLAATALKNISPPVKGTVDDKAFKSLQTLDKQVSSAAKELASVTAASDSNDDTAKNALAKAKTAISALKATAGSAAAKGSTKADIKNAGAAEDRAIADLKTAANGPSKANTAPETDTAGYKGITDSQAKAMEQMQWNFLRNDAVPALLMTCVSVLRTMLVDQEGHLVSGSYELNTQAPESLHAASIGDSSGKGSPQREPVTPPVSDGMQRLCTSPVLTDLLGNDPKNPKIAPVGDAPIKNDNAPSESQSGPEQNKARRANLTDALYLGTFNSLVNMQQDRK